MRLPFRRPRPQPRGRAEGRAEGRGFALDRRTPSFYRAYRVTVVSFLIAVVAFGLYSVFWFALAAKLENGTEAWIEQRRAEGLDIRYADLRSEGFPFLIRIVLRAPRIRIPIPISANKTEPPQSPGSPQSSQSPQSLWAWQGDAVVIQARPWSPRHIKADISGAQRVSLVIKGTPVTYAGRAGVLAADLVFEGGGRLSEIQITVAGLELTSADGGSKIAARTARLTARRLSIDATDITSPAFYARLTARDVVVPDRLALPLGSTIEKLDAEGTLIGALPPELPPELSPGLSSNPWPQPLITWRDRGGTIEVAHINIVYGPLAMRTSGTLALDADLQPIGAFTAKIQGLVASVGILRRRGLIGSRDAITAQLILGALARKPADGGPESLSVPITIQDRRLFIGPVRLTKLPEIHWENLDPGGGRTAE